MGFIKWYIWKSDKGTHKILKYKLQRHLPEIKEESDLRIQKTLHIAGPFHTEMYPSYIIVFFS